MPSAVPTQNTSSEYIVECLRVFYTARKNVVVNFALTCCFILLFVGVNIHIVANEMGPFLPHFLYILFIQLMSSERRCRVQTLIIRQWPNIRRSWSMSTMSDNFWFSFLQFFRPFRCVKPYGYCDDVRCCATNYFTSGKYL